MGTVLCESLRRRHQSVHLGERSPGRTWLVQLVVLCSLIWLLVPVGAASGQEGAFAFELRGGGAFPLGSFRSGDDGWAGEVRTSTAFGMGFTLPGPGPLGTYLGFGQRRFECREPTCPSGKEWTSTGFDVALRLVLGRGPVRRWLRGGFHNLRLVGTVRDHDGGTARVTAAGGGGIEAGGGLLVSIGRRTSLSPGVRYGWGEVPFPGRGKMRLRYFAADIGLVLGF